MIFLDASAAVKGYLTEEGSASIEAAQRRLSGRIVVTAHVALEVVTTFAKRLRTSTIRRTVYRSALGRFLGDYSARFFVAPVEDRAFQRAFGLAEAHRGLSVGAMDVLHVASALEFQSRLGGGKPLVMASSDRGLLSLARAAGLSTFNPEMEPLGALLSKVGD
jgi:predicted nucleic acid-binding protein